MNCPRCEQSLAPAEHMQNQFLWCPNCDLDFDFEGNSIDHMQFKCPKCDLLSTKDGHDPCIADLPGVAFACCGHGRTKGYVAFANGECIRGNFDQTPAMWSHTMCKKNLENALAAIARRLTEGRFKGV